MKIACNRSRSFHVCMRRLLIAMQSTKVAHIQVDFLPLLLLWCRHFVVATVAKLTNCQSKSWLKMCSKKMVIPTMFQHVCHAFLTKRRREQRKKAVWTEKSDSTIVWQRSNYMTHINIWFDRQFVHTSVHARVSRRKLCTSNRSNQEEEGKNSFYTKKTAEKNTFFFRSLFAHLVQMLALQN